MKTLEQKNMRNPSIHIRRSDLVAIFKSMYLDVSAARIDDIMREAMKRSIRNRIMVELPAKARQKAARIVETETDWVDIFNGIYMSVMLENNIQTISIHKKDPQYLTLKEITGQAINFCEAFDTPYREGFKIYIQLGVTLLNKKYSLYRLKAVADRIAAVYRDTLTINNDPTPELTIKIYSYWKVAMQKYAGIEFIEVNQHTDKYVHFVYAKQDAEEVKAEYEDWINAQFEKWAFLKAVPEFSQLHGDNAKINYTIFIGKGPQDEDAEYNKLIQGDKEKAYKDVKFQPRTKQG